MRWLFLLAIVCAPAWACSCGGYPSAKDAYLDSPLVFTGFVDKTDPRITSERDVVGEQIAWVRVTEPFKGVKKDQVLELRGQGSSCFGGVREGTALLFYLYPGQKPGTWVAPVCHRSSAHYGAARTSPHRHATASARLHRQSIRCAHRIAGFHRRAAACRPGGDARRSAEDG